MNKQEIEEKVKHAFTNDVPDVLDCIISECDNQKHQNGRIKTMLEVKPVNNIFKWAAGIAAVLVIGAAGLVGVNMYRANREVAAVISLDVNPSIEIRTNQREKILSVNALNNDGRVVIGDMSFEGSSLDYTVNALVDSMMSNGYLTDSADSILVTVYSNYGDSNALLNKLSGEINSIFAEDSFDGTVLSQTISPNEELQSIADSYGISLGKAKFISTIANEYADYSVEDLAGMTISNLRLIGTMDESGIDGVQIDGNTGEEYIGIENVKTIAFAQAGVTSESDVVKLEIEMDVEHGIVIYEVSFTYGDYKYNYDINAVTGEIVQEKGNPIDNKGKDENPDTTTSAPDDTATPAPDNTSTSTPDSPSTPDSSSTTTNAITYAEVKQIAFNRAGVTSESDVSKVHIEMDKENGITVYEIEFNYNDYEYDLEINASTGEVLKYRAEPIDSKGKEDKTPTSVSTGAITSEEALRFAFLKAGVPSESDVSGLEIETGSKHGMMIYEISFEYRDFKYEFDIKALNGAIIEMDKEPLNKNHR